MERTGILHRVSSIYCEITYSKAFFNAIASVYACFRVLLKSATIKVSFLNSLYKVYQKSLPLFYDLLDDI